MQDWNQLARRLSGVSRTVGMCWKLVNREWKVWMPVRCSQVSLSLKEVFLSRIIVSWRSEPPGKTIFATMCLRMALSCATVVPHFMWCHILNSYKRYVTIFATAGNENGIGRSPDQFFPCGEKWSGNKTNYNMHGYMGIPGLQIGRTSFVIHLEKGRFGARTDAVTMIFECCRCNTWVAYCPCTKGKTDINFVGHQK